MLSNLSLQGAKTGRHSEAQAWAPQFAGNVMEASVTCSVKFSAVEPSILIEGVGLANCSDTSFQAISVQKEKP
jgi:hypothetical protein